MRSSPQFRVTLPNKRAGLVGAKVVSGEYASENEVIRDGIRALNARKSAVDDWLRQQALPSYDAYLADLSKAIPLEDVRATIGKRD